MNDTHRTPGMFSTLALIAVGTLAAAGIAMVAIHTHLAEREMVRVMRRVASATCHKLADVLENPIWKLDDAAMRHYFSIYPMPPAMISATVLTEFGDTVFKAEFPGHGERADARLITAECPVERNGERIGTVVVAFSRAEMDAVRRRMVFSNGMVIGVGCLAFALVALFIGRAVVHRPMDELVQAIDRIGAADYSVRLPRMPYRELQSIADRIDRMAGHIRERADRLEAEIRRRTGAQRDLQSLTDSLEHEVASQTDDLRAMNRSLEQEIRERRQVQDEMLRAISREQQRIGHDIHDSLGQQVAGIAFAAGSLARKLRSEGRDAAALAEQIAEHLTHAVSQTRQIARGLAPIESMDRSLESALRQLAAEVGDLFGLACSVEWTGEDIRDEHVATQLYRIAQEAVHNARRHGHARNVRIVFAREGDTASLLVVDDGVGLPDDYALRGGTGLHTMRYRTEELHGICSIESEDASGSTTVRITFPASGI